MKWILLFVLLAATVGSYMVPPAAGFPEPDLARVIFFHLPCAYCTALFVIFAAFCGARYLLGKEMIWEYRSHAANDIALTIGVATMVTGIIFSKVQWGAWWHWDARQTSFLMVLMLLGGYFMLRRAFDDEVMRARVAAAYSAMTLLPVLFLIFVFPKLPQVAQNSLHPQGVVAQMKFSGDYRTVVFGVFIPLFFYCAWLYKMHVRASLLEEKLKENYGNLEAHRNGPSPRRVDGAIPVHSSSAETD